MNLKTKLLHAVVAGCLLAIGILTSVAAQQATPEPPECTAGSSGIGDPYFPLMGNSGYDVLHYDLALDLDVAGGAIESGRATIDAVALVDLCAFNLDFRGLEIDGITVDHQAATFSRLGGELTVKPAAALPAGSPFSVAVTYHGTPLGQDAPTAGSLMAMFVGGMLGAGGEQKSESPEGEQYGPGWWKGRDAIFIAGEPRGAETWFPANGHPADKATYSLRLTVPKPYQVVANGALRETTETEASTTTVWQSRDPMASYLVTFHAARLDIEERIGPDGLPLRFAFAQSIGASQRAMFDRLPEMIAYFETVFGPYPFESAGGTVVGSPILFALETQTLPTFGEIPLAGNQPLTAADLKGLEPLVAHELAHQWYGNTVSLLRWQDIWLNEGFATYAQLLWIEHDEGIVVRNHFIARLYAFHAALAPFQDPDQLATLDAKAVLDGYRTYSRRFSDVTIDEQFVQRYLDGLNVESVADLEGISAADGLAQLGSLGVDEQLFPGKAVLTGDPGPANLFSPAAVYERGALTLHALRLRVGDDAFFQILRQWPVRFHDGNATTADFVTLSEAISGQELGEFFDAWLYQPGLPPLTPAKEVESLATPVPS